MQTHPLLEEQLTVPLRHRLLKDSVPSRLLLLLLSIRLDNSNRLDLVVKVKVIVVLLDNPPTKLPIPHVRLLKMFRITLTRQLNLLVSRLIRRQTRLARLLRPLGRLLRTQLKRLATLLRTQSSPLVRPPIKPPTLPNQLRRTSLIPLDRLLKTSQSLPDRPPPASPNPLDRLPPTLPSLLDRPLKQQSPVSESGSTACLASSRTLAIFQLCRTPKAQLRNKSDNYALLLVDPLRSLTSRNAPVLIESSSSSEESYSLLTLLPPSILAVDVLESPGSNVSNDDDKFKGLLAYFVVLGFIQFLESLAAGVLAKTIRESTCLYSLDVPHPSLFLTLVYGTFRG
ncbi:hypothetical protein BCR39DRAFT_385423 [Naematelia encephala]|uniref:Uncharacterized protein n=1 Tax=Naematelia encephala TaxID=71784 RepID=A0A1Y2AIQ7_9TREE|nr:hypothetical protein BCR39DRAFT_385423 [Naematelia encephala]